MAVIKGSEQEAGPIKEANVCYLLIIFTVEPEINSNLSDYGNLAKSPQFCCGSE